MRRLIWAGIIVQVAAYASFIGLGIVREVECYSLTTLHKSLCLSSYKVNYTEAVFSALTDAYLLIMPIRVVMQLQLDLQRKMGVLMVFMTGLM